MSCFWGESVVEKTSKNWNSIERLVIILADILIFNFSIWLSYRFKFGKDIPIFNFSAYQSIAIYATIFFVLISILLGTYVFYNRTLGDVFFSTLVSQALTTVVMITLSFLGRSFSFPRSVLGYSFIISTILLFIWRACVYFGYQHISPVKKVTIIGKQTDVAKALRNFDTSKNKKHMIVNAILDNYYQNLLLTIEDSDVVYLADSDINEPEKVAIEELVMKKEKNLFLPTNFENLLLNRPNMMNFEDESVIEVSPFRISIEQAFFKRLIDIVVSLIGIIILSPILLVTAIIVKFTSPGPIIYSQTRITLNQKEFKIYKFRTMSQSAEKKSGPVLAKANDARVTTVGKYLRKLRIDEIPQFFNVLKGDMSIVGPRPERPFFVDKFCEEESSYIFRHNVRAGITGYAQVYGKYASDFRSKLQFDLLYIKKYSLALDVKILLQTIKILFDKVSSQGVDEDEIQIELVDLEKKGIKILR